MSSVALIGAGGVVGSLIARDLTAGGHDVQAVSRDRERLPVGCQVVINAAGGGEGVAAGLARVAVRAGCHLIDVVPEQAHVRALYDTDPAALAAGSVIVPGAGFQHLIGDTLAHLAGTATRSVREIHVAYTLPGRGGMLADASRGRRRSAARELDAPVLALVRGERRREGIAEQRRLAWFPRPVGPAHVAGIGGGEVISVPGHLPTVETVRTYVALTGWRCELVQFTANLARIDAVRGRLVRRIERRGVELDAARRARIRWGAVAEADGRDGVARAWAYGHDPYRLTAAAAVACTERVLTGAVDPGVRAPAELGAAGELLDVLSTRTDLRWSITRPDPEAGAPRG